ncbi:hypothetical protein KKI95_01975 [Xenorhabdus bovienii]|uniref:ATP-grasp domain-containing protein n=1 Tax=Xenorhabdus bovienii TaxID=40576 RepID=UPI00237C6CA9|nr:hypothetical protein [Xenorhabdus bovienii]MDE1481699.1 hypothetical protein [Xenorhabdus bovienii]MDE9431625.1 hypothetical protein [Xenorhabdus bovienii]MDE9434739.1 hypothetical protein [Xenorhabdus bovienii]MDE9440526.1 hypothetical protein [Xenorhabdus bovienii]MDE9488936.1 hypothetical protein [Xenorhabdus bovienii]
MSERALILDINKTMLEQSINQHPDVDYIRISASQIRFAPQEETLTKIDNIMNQTPFHYVVASSESNMEFAGFLRSRYGLPGLNYEQALCVTNKWRMRKCLADNLPVPKCWLSGHFYNNFAQFTQGSATHFIIKPLSGFSCQNVERLTVDQLRQKLKHLDTLMLIEEAIDIEEEFHLDGIVNQSEIITAHLSCYSLPILSARGQTRASIHLLSSHPMFSVAYSMAQRAIAKLGLKQGVFHMEVYGRGNQLTFGEIGLRPPGAGVAESLLRFTGMNLWQAFVNSQLLRPIDSTPPQKYNGYSGVIGIYPEGYNASDLLLLPNVVAVSEVKKTHQKITRSGANDFRYLVFASCQSQAEFHTLINQLSEYPPSTHAKR